MNNYQSDASLNELVSQPNPYGVVMTGVASV